MSTPDAFEERLEAARDRRAARRPVPWWALAAVLGLIVAVVAGSTVWHFAQPDERSTASIEKQVAAGISKQTGLTAVKVRCPDPVEWRVGEDFHCFGVATGSPRIPVTVTMENDKGAVSWRVE